MFLRTFKNLINPIRASIYIGAVFGVCNTLDEFNQGFVNTFSVNCFCVGFTHGKVFGTDGCGVQKLIILVPIKGTQSTPVTNLNGTNTFANTHLVYRSAMNGNVCCFCTCFIKLLDSQRWKETMLKKINFLRIC